MNIRLTGVIATYGICVYLVTPILMSESLLTDPIPTLRDLKKT